MFSGLVGAVGTVRAVRRRSAGARLEVACALGGGPLTGGESIAVSGPCLTVAEVTGDGFAADISPETLRRTTLGAFGPGTAVNLERSLRLSDRLGGHLVMGHVDATARVVAVRGESAFRVLRFSLPGAQAPEVAEKGSVAVDGVSLTVAAVGEGWFETAVIPATLEATTLGGLRAGATVNLETDVIAKYVRRAVAGESRSLSSLLEGLGDAAG